MELADALCAMSMRMLVAAAPSLVCTFVGFLCLLLLARSHSSIVSMAAPKLLVAAQR